MVVHCRFTQQIFYVTLRKQEYIVGRANADLLLTGDTSISRKHSSIYIAKRSDCPFPVKSVTGLWLKDNGSKYGTYIKQGEEFVQVEPNVDKPLRHGSRVRFGIINNDWSVECNQLLGCPSQLPEAIITGLMDKLTQLGGLLTTQFDERCSFVITSGIVLSAKVVLALIYGIPIVTPIFIEEICSAVEACEKLPDPKKFLPPLQEPAIKTSSAIFDYEHNRRTLFTGLTFYSGSTEQINSHKAFVEGAGGEIVLFDDRNPEKLISKGAVLLEHVVNRGSQMSSASSQSQNSQCWDNSITELLEKNGRRTVPQSEILMAIVYSSVLRHCNPCCMDFTPRIGQGSSGATNFTPSDVIEDYTEPMQTNSTSHGVVEASLSQQRQSLGEKVDTPPCSKTSASLFAVPSTSHTTGVTQLTKTGPISGGVSNKSTSGAAPTPRPLRLQSAVAPAQKRSAEEDLFEDGRSNKGTGDSLPPATKKQMFWDTESGKPATSATSTRTFQRSVSPTSQRSRAPVNPFGEVLGSTTPLPIEKRPLQDSEEISFLQPERKKNKVVDAKAMVSRPDLIPQPRVPEVETPLRRPPETDSRGFIDMSFKKEDPCDESALDKTVVWMSLLAIPGAETWSKFTPSPEASTSNGLKNVKIFRKQSVINVSTDQAVPLESMETLTDNWLSETPS